MKPRKFEPGELTRIIIGTVVASTIDGPSDDGITSKELAAKLSAQGIAMSRYRASIWLAQLADRGRINRIGRGRYEGV
jgi:hypothetical protein